MVSRIRWRTALATRLATGLCAIALAAGCTNAPPPPLVTSEPPRPEPTTPIDPGEAVVGVDSLAGGYNPHKLADQSTITTALSTVLLPSVFRPGPDGTPVLDRTLMVSAEVTSSQPYQVTYRLRPDAAWSDSAPIAAEDFDYLWTQAKDAPGVVHAAGYRLITKIAAREAGRVVEVTFDKPYPGWRSLFGNLLPAHLLKDIPGGWSSALRDGFPVTGGPFSVKSLDRDRGEVILERNDRYWAVPATLDRIILRRGDATAISGALRTGHEQLAVARVDRPGLGLLSALAPVVTLQTVPRPTVATVLLRPVGADLADLKVRTAVTALIDRAALIRAGTGAGPAADLIANAQGLAPSAAGYTPTLDPAVPPSLAQPIAAETLLTEAGYVKVAGVWMKAGVPLALTIAAPADRTGYPEMAADLRRQLVAAGIDATVQSPSSDDLVAALDPETRGAQVHLAIVPQDSAGDPATVLATRFGCASGAQAGAAPTSANQIGFCDPVVQQTLDAALTGTVSVAEALRVLEPQLWAQHVTVPLYQEADTLVLRPEMTGVAQGAAFTGPFAGAAQWRRATG